ncbi:AAA domain-containing protein [Parelusimicrobium proximum]|uniref:ABC-F family ATP-binding cassette domain-containing protein n=1 Tax=Parelusimicrobium proximum TaxID=3228953 RepID=UPI003D17270C
MHKPIEIKNLSLYFSDKICFEDFSARITDGDRIAVIGRNGSGKSTLIKILAGLFEPSDGEIKKDAGIVFGYVPQIVTEYNDLSGGERFNKALTAAMAVNPDVLLLDEPTNHLDVKNRHSLMQMLKYYCGTLVIVSHDEELLNGAVNTIWRIDDGHIDIFTGSYTDYLDKIVHARNALESEVSELSKEKRRMHMTLMHEQERAKKSRIHGEKQAAQGRWAPIVAGGKKRQAEVTASSKKEAIRGKTDDVNSRLRSIRMPEIIKPKFSISADDVDKGTIVIVRDGCVGYGERVVLKDVSFSLAGSDRLGITGDNASGKTTLIRAMLGDSEVSKSGEWLMPKASDIGYLDQHYSTLDSEKTVLETIKEAMPAKTHAELRDFLNDFLFRKQEEVSAKTSVLSGGERARLSLALIAAKTPRLLILDEITNNVDLETKAHITQVLNAYPGAIIAISHEKKFLDDINIERFIRTS